MAYVNLTSVGCMSASRRIICISFLSNVHGLCTMIRSISSLLLKTARNRLSSMSRTVIPPIDAHKFLTVALNASPLKGRNVNRRNNKLNLASVFDCWIFPVLSLRLLLSDSDNLIFLHFSANSSAISGCEITRDPNKVWLENLALRWQVLRLLLLARLESQACLEKFF